MGLLDFHGSYKILLALHENTQASGLELMKPMQND
jgi:hypothetical protein